MHTDIATYDRHIAEMIPAQASSDEQMIAIWINRSGSPRTRRNYLTWAARFLAFSGKTLSQVTVGDLQAFGQSITDRAPASQALAISSIKSLLTTAYELGFIRFNPGKAIKAPAVKRTLAERILSESDVQRMLHLEPDPRNRALLTLVYAAGLRVSEATGLHWRDLQARDNRGQVTVVGKGSKTRAVLLSAGVWEMLQALPQAGKDEPVFKSRKGGTLDASAVHRVVKAAAQRAGINAETSCHWLRHAHASHALDRGAPIHLVQQTLGHRSVATTGIYLHARPNESSGLFLAV